MFQIDRHGRGVRPQQTSFFFAFASLASSDDSSAPKTSWERARLDA
jgi:hypothetical protein